MERGSHKDSVVELPAVDGREGFLRSGCCLDLRWGCLPIVLVGSSLVLGFSVFKEEKLRLRGVDAPGLETDRGKKAKKFVEKELAGCEFLVLKTYGTDLYDRYIADVFYIKEAGDVEDVIGKGEFLNNRLLEEGLAERGG